MPYCVVFVQLSWIYFSVKQWASKEETKDKGFDVLVYSNLREGDFFQ